MKTLHGIQEVSGSIPLISTKRKALKPLYINGFKAFLFVFVRLFYFLIRCQNSGFNHGWEQIVNKINCLTEVQQLFEAVLCRHEYRPY